MAGYIEDENKLSTKVKDLHQAIESLREELEAVDFYNQRMEVCKNPELKKILRHNRDEEKEHAAMLIEWLRRNDDVFEKELKEFLFTKKPLTHD